MEKKAVKVISACPRSNTRKHFLSESWLISQRICFWECGTMLSKQKLKISLNKKTNK